MLQNIDNLDDTRARWDAISDNVMGGVSEVNFYEMNDGSTNFYRLEGSVSTKNNGGFIQLRSTLSFANINEDEKVIKGVRLNARGNGETYHIFIRTNETRSYSDFYSATFIAKSKWEIIDLPFTKFKRTFSNTTLEGKDIRTFAIVAYGREFFSDVSVSKIIFYY